MKNKGITLVALVVTMIVLLILAGVALSTLLGDDGIIQQAQDAKIASEKAELEEQIKAEIVWLHNNYSTFDATLLKNNIEKNISGSEVIGDTFPLTITAKGLTYKITSNGTVTLDDGG